MKLRLRVDRHSPIGFDVAIMTVQQNLTIPSELTGHTVAAAIKRLGGERSWSEVKRLISQRQIRINGTLCLDEARRVKSGEVIMIAGQSAAPVPRESSLNILHLDEDLVIVDKPAGIQTLRRHEERSFSEEKKRLQPTLDELLARRLISLGKGTRAARPGSAPGVRVRVVHRLDRDTSGLMLFALTPRAETAMIKQFAAHEVKRIYTAVVHGRLEGRHTINTLLVRDRGDGVRGSLPEETTDEASQRAITHLKAIEHLGNRYTLLECRLETGRTHQIRIHLSEMGHRLCGEGVYTRPNPGELPLADDSGAPRQALHSSMLEAVHPVTGEPLRFESPMPADLHKWLQSLRGR